MVYGDGRIPPPQSGTRLVNLSTRGQAQTGENLLIGGFVIEDTAPLQVLIRARGPSLASSGVTGVLANPMLTLYSGQTPIVSNDDWQEHPTTPWSRRSSSL